MKSKITRVISFFLVCFVCLNLLSNPIMGLKVYATNSGSASENAKNFINFTQDKDAMSLSVKDLSNQDYYALFNFMSNWFQPGITTLADLYNAEGSFYTAFSQSLNMGDNADLKNIVKSFGKDFVNGINAGDCTIVTEGGAVLNGTGFLNKFVAAVPETWVTGEVGKELSSSKVYFKTEGNIAFDFSSDAVRAAFQTALAYNPDMFLMDNGIVSLDMLYLDASGNLWGATSNALPDGYDKTNTYNKGNTLDINKLNEVYLILPACLNPAAFSPKVTNQKDLRMPLMNRFVLSSLVLSSDITNSEGMKYVSEFIPIFNALAYANTNNLKNVLNVVGIHSLSPYTLNTGDISNKTWGLDARKEALANFAYNPKSITISRNSSTTGGTGSTGKLDIATNSYLAFCMNLGYIKGANGEGGDGNGVIDGNTGFGAWFGENSLAFTALSGTGEGNKLTSQKRLLMYFFNPTLLPLDKVSMNFYNYEGDNSSDTSLSTQFTEYLADTEKSDFKVTKDGDNESFINDVTENGLTSSDITKLGISGMSLYLNDIVVDMIDGVNKYYLVSPDNMTHSKLVDLLENNGKETLGEHSSTLYNSIINGNGYTESETLNYLFYNKNKSGIALSLMSTLNSVFQDETDATYTLLNGKSLDFSKGLSFTGNTYYVLPKTNSFTNFGSNDNDFTFGRLLSLNDKSIRKSIQSTTNSIKDLDDSISVLLYISEIPEYILALYGYSLFFPTSSFDSGTGLVGTTATPDTLSAFGATNMTNKQSTIKMKTFSDKLMMGVYLGYVVDMMGLGTCDAEAGLNFGSFTSVFLPKYSISAAGGNLSIEGVLKGATGVEKSDDLSFEEKQKDLINRIYGLTNDGNNDYRNNLIKNILEGFILTVHRTITGTWGSNISTISTGSSSTYQSVTGYIYTPTLEELSFTSSLMNNYIKIYIICALIILFLLILMVLLHHRTWQQGILIFLIMSVALLFPYILISNSVNVSNKISDTIYSDRFDFWAMTEHLQSVTSLQGSEFMDKKDKWLVEGSATTDPTKIGATGVKIKWMAPKKVDTFQELYSDASLSQSFVTNMEIFKWLFSSTIYDSEFVDTDVYGSYVYRRYNNIALEAESYYSWGLKLQELNQSLTTVSNLNYNGNSYNSTKGLVNTLYILGDENSKLFSAGIGRLDNSFYTSNFGSKLQYSDERYADILKVSQYDEGNVANLDSNSDKIGTWGLYSSDVNNAIMDDDSINNIVNPGIVSNLPMESSAKTSFDSVTDDGLISKAIFLKNTESPYYYFYSVLKSRYSNPTLSTSNFKKSLLQNNVFKVDNATIATLSTNKNLNNTYRDFLDLEGLFEYVIPYLNLSNQYVANWQKVNGSAIEEYNFEYEVTEDGLVDLDTVGLDHEGSIVTGESNVSGTYQEATKKKNAMNRVWNMYSPWVDSLHDLNIYNKKVSVGGKNLYITNTLNPSSYVEQGRPMIFSEADMIVRGYTYKDLTDVERRIQAVTEKTYKDLRYLVNYYDMDDEVLICAAAMYATFNFNSEFSQSSFLGESVMLYPQGFELKNFNYDAFMRLALLNSTGESVFASDDLYSRVLAKTSVFTGLLLIVCDLIACIAIPMFKFIILIGLLFLGILICIACVINPPEKIFEAVNKSLLLPTVLFMALNIGFSWVMSLIVGEGLTAYVGSKGVNFATNDPTITMLIMAFLGMAYLFFAWKILKFLIQAYKNFGMGTALAAVGVIGAAIAAGTAGVAKKAQKAGAFGLGAGVGAVVAGKDNRLGGAVDGAQKGAGAMINSRIREKRAAKDFASATGGKPGLTDKLNGLSNETGSGNGLNGKDPVKDEGTTKIPKQGTKIDKSKTPEPPSELGKPFEKATNKNATGLGKVISGGYYLKEKAKDTLDSVKHKTVKTGMALKNVGQGIKEAPRKTANAIKDMPNKATNYWNKSLKQAKEDGEFYELLGDTRKGERVADEMGTGRELATRQRKFDEESKAIKEAKSAKKEAKKRRVDGDYSLQEA